MFGDLSDFVDAAATFSHDLFEAQLEEAKAEVKAAAARISKLKKQQRAIDKFVANYRAMTAKAAKESKRAQEKWNKQARKRAKDAIPAMFGGAPVVSVPMAPDRRRA